MRAAALADPTEVTLAEAITLLRMGKLTSTTLTEAYLERIARFEPSYQAYNAITADAAMAAARQQDQQRTGVLGGIPLCVKDNFFTAGVPTTAPACVRRA